MPDRGPDLRTGRKKREVPRAPEEERASALAPRPALDVPEPVEKEFRWTPIRARAAMLVAVSDDRSIANIAAELGMHASNLQNLRRQPEFLARVQHHVETQLDKVLQVGIVRKQQRLHQLNDMSARLDQIIEERVQSALLAIEDDPDLAQRAPGLRTGFIVRVQKMIGTGASAEQVDEWKLDDALIQARLRIHKQTAQELGQWVERREHSGELDITHTQKISIEDLREALRPQLPAGSTIDGEAREIE